MSNGAKNYPAAYQSSSAPVLNVDTDFYKRLVREPERRTKIGEVEVPIRTGRAWKVPAGHVFRITTHQGPQVGDLNLWNANNPRERMWVARTRQLQGAHVTTYDRLWSSLPFLRPMATIIDDTLAGYGTDEHGGRVHDLLGTRCDPYMGKLLTGRDVDHHCHSNLVRAVAPFGLVEADVHDVLNVFQVTGLNQDEMYFMKASPARVGDYIEFFAEIDLLCAISACPGGDLSLPIWTSSDADLVSICRPLHVSIFAVPDDVLRGWREPVCANYQGTHGLEPRPAAPVHPHD